MSEGATPIRKQYLGIKRKYPGAIVLFRLGDFYETFDEDARITSRELGIVLTSREMGKGHRVPMAGIPYHALDNYLGRLINRGYKVAICEQVTKAGETKGLVKRDVVRVVTPGTVVEPSLLDSKTNNYLVGVVLGENEAGIAYVDITTSEFAVTQLPLERAISEVERLKPTEIVTTDSSDLAEFGLAAPIAKIEDHWAELEISSQVLIDHFDVSTLEGYGCAYLPLAIRAAGAVVHYIQETQKRAMGQLTHLITYSTESYMALDVQTQRNLELFQGSRYWAASSSLLSVIDLTKTAMGGRLLKRWVGQPSLDIMKLDKRLDAVGWFVDNTIAREQVISLLSVLTDLERLINRVRGLLSTPRELMSLKVGLTIIPKLLKIIDANSIRWLKETLKSRQDVIDLISDSITESPPSSLDEGGVIKAGFSEELDKLRGTAQNARQHLTNLERREKEKTGIKSLKVGYNRVFGYYIEVSKANLPQVPERYIRKQTLVGGERFFTPELKEYESLILNSQGRIVELETSIFQNICQQVAMVGEQVLAAAHALARIDVFSSLAEVAVRYNYVRPTLNNENKVVISQGRHPVVERTLMEGSFLPNDICLANDDAQIIILTGPNMSGKSTYLRQVALIVLMAQMGSFVSATSATIGLTDRVFTRIGAGEDIAAGQSTFMVEMIETANILNNATPCSLIILDEIGRGTSTYDGLSIARAVVEYIHNHHGLGAKTLFATHYHELVEMASFLPRVKNFNVSIAGEEDKVIFLHKIMPGGVDKSYGIHVAQMAGLPKSVVHRANEVLSGLEENHRKIPSMKGKRCREAVPEQISLFGQKSPLLEEMKKLDIDSLTPLEAITRLYEMQKKARESQ